MLDKVVSELANASPYALLLALGFGLFFYMHKVDVDKMEKMSRESVEHIKELSKSSIAEIRRAYEKANSKN